MKKLIAMILTVLLITTWIYSQDLTDDEILFYWGSLTKAERIEEIRTLDKIEHAEPQIVMPPLVAILTGRDLYISYENPPEGRHGLLINIADKLEYSIELEAVRVENFVPSNIKTYITVGVGCLAVGVISGLLIPR